MTRFVRRIAACVALATLAFGQIVMSAHACEGVATAATAATPATTAEHDCCDPTQKPAEVCEHFCDYAAASVDTLGASTLFAPAAPAALRVESVAVVHRFASYVAERPLERREDPPPLARLVVLRI